MPSFGTSGAQCTIPNADGAKAGDPWTPLRWARGGHNLHAPTIAVAPGPSPPSDCSLLLAATAAE